MSSEAATNRCSPNSARAASVVMSAKGYSRPSHLASTPTNVRYASDSDRILRRSEMTLRANRVIFLRSKQGRYSISGSARCCKSKGTSRPSALAVLRLIISSNLTGFCTGSSPGFAPLRMRSV
jgi:hypothetical protein